MNAPRVLFVSNGHGEVAIASRIARELGGMRCEHMALVAAAPAGNLQPVGPLKAMPSGGLIAMGNVRNIVRDVASGLLGHTLAQLRFLRAARGTYDVAVAVGDVFALIMALTARARSTVYVGTAKSVHHAKYGPLERRVIARAQRAFVRDEATAQSLRLRGIGACAANVIVDLYAVPDAGRITVPFSPLLALFPGSREQAYEDAVSLCAIVRDLAASDAKIGALLSVAPGLDAQRMAGALQHSGWRLAQTGAESEPFSLFAGEREVVRAWRGPLGAMLERASLVLGQAGTANEAAAAAGIPVVAYERSSEGKRAWYRARQAGLLGGALLVVSGDPSNAAAGVRALLDDAPRRERMGKTGRERMGPAGGAALIAKAIESLAGGTP